MGMPPRLLVSLLLLPSLELAAAPPPAPARRVRWFTDADQQDSNWAFATAHRGEVSGLYPCCGALAAAANGSLLLGTAPAAAHNLSEPYRRLGLSVHPVIALDDNATLEAAAAPGSTFAADAVALSERFNFSGVAFDYEAAGDYRTYARLLRAVSAAMHAAVPRREVVVCVDTSNIFDNAASFAAIEAAGVDLQLSMSTYKWEGPLHERKYVEVLTRQGVPPSRISAGLLSCPANYSAACRERGSSGSQGDWTAERLRGALRYLDRARVPEVAVWPAAGWLDAAPWYFTELRSWLRQDGEPRAAAGTK